MSPPVDEERVFLAAIEAVIRAIEPGTVLTYGEVAAEAGFPGAARAVGNHLRLSGGTLPWWRVVAATGRLVPGHEAEHARRLRRDGVAVSANRVVMGRPVRRRRTTAAGATTRARPREASRE